MALKCVAPLEALKHIELAETFDVDENEDLVKFCYTVATLVLEDGAYAGTLSDRQHEATEEAIRQCLRRIPDDQVFPVCPEGIQIFAKEIHDDKIYMKRPSVFSYSSELSSTAFADSLLDEVQIYEQLKLSPHRNLAAYRGCTIRNGRITAIALSWYPSQLRCPDASTDISLRQRWMQGIEDGITHLHKLGLAHNDLNPENIMLDESDNAIIIDFDSCATFGAKLRKGGTPDWEGPTPGISAAENDRHALELLRRGFGLVAGPSEVVEAFTGECNDGTFQGEK